MGPQFATQATKRTGTQIMENEILKDPLLHELHGKKEDKADLAYNEAAAANLLRQNFKQDRSKSHKEKAREIQAITEAELKRVPLTTANLQKLEADGVGVLPGGRRIDRKREQVLDAVKSRAAMGGPKAHGGRSGYFPKESMEVRHRPHKTIPGDGTRVQAIRKKGITNEFEEAAVNRRAAYITKVGEAMLDVL